MAFLPIGFIGAFYAPQRPRPPDFRSVSAKGCSPSSTSDASGRNGWKADISIADLIASLLQRKLRPIGEGVMGRVFLSYARADAAAAEKLAEAIAAAGHGVWWDRHIHGGSRFASEIDRALKDAEAIVVLWSQASCESVWVQDEAGEGRDSGRLVPATLDSTRPPLGFRQFQSVDLSGWNDLSRPEDLSALLVAIERISDAANRTKPAGEKEAISRKPARLSICVLPFANMSGEPEQEYFSDGISEDIITDLSKVSALSVVARNTAFTFKGSAVDVPTVARKLNVSHVLEGSVRKAGGRVRITAQLIDGAAGDHIWAERYDRDLNDIFALQAEISEAIVAALRLKLLPDEKKAIADRGTSSVDAYNLYLMARQYWIAGTFGDVQRDETIVRICRQATLLDPNYAQAWALMALAQSELRFWHSRPENALPAAERALSINPGLPEARCVKARYLEEEGRQAEANDQIDIALQLDPESWEVNREAARLMFRQGRIREASPYFERAAALMSTDWHNPSMLITCYHALGAKEALQRVAHMTLERAESAIAKDPTNGAALAAGAAALAINGEQDRAKEWIQRALLLDPDNISVRYNLACVLIIELKDAEGALDLLEPYFGQVNSATFIKHLEADPDFESLRGHPRFQQLLAQAKVRLGLSCQTD